jgi:AcrR family transcriptional regulator
VSDSNEREIPVELVRTAIREARRRQEDVADVPLTALAAAAGVSRSTLLRRIGGSRRALDDAVRAAGVDPGGRRPVRERAIEAGGLLISDQGPTALTLEAVAAAARCSVHSVYAAFGGRDQLMAAIYQRYSPATDLAGLMTGLPGTLEEIVPQVYRALARSFSREPRVVPAMLADLFSRPDGPASAVFRRYFPSVVDRIGGWLGKEVQAGRLRPLPLVLLVEQFLGPLTMHLLLRPAMEQVPGAELPDIEEACAVFTDAFLRAAALPDAKD